MEKHFGFWPTGILGEKPHSSPKNFTCVSSARDTEEVIYQEKELEKSICRTEI